MLSGLELLFLFELHNFINWFFLLILYACVAQPGKSAALVIKEPNGSSYDISFDVAKNAEVESSILSTGFINHDKSRRIQVFGLRRCF
jgi:hypothetical protein